jgi:hypothetical protein
LAILRRIQDRAEPRVPLCGVFDIVDVTFYSFLIPSLGLVGPLWSKLYEQRDIMGGNGDTPGTKHPEEPRMGGIPEQVESGKPDNNDDKDGIVRQT